MFPVSTPRHPACISRSSPPIRSLVVGSGAGRNASDARGRGFLGAEPRGGGEEGKMAVGEWFSLGSFRLEETPGRGSRSPCLLAVSPPPPEASSFPSSNLEAGQHPRTSCQIPRRRARTGNWKSSCWGTAPPGRSVLGQTRWPGLQDPRRDQTGRARAGAERCPALPPPAQRSCRLGLARLGPRPSLRLRPVRVPDARPPGMTRSWGGPLQKQTQTVRMRRPSALRTPELPFQGPISL